MLFVPIGPIPRPLPRPRPQPRPALPGEMTLDKIDVS